MESIFSKKCTRLEYYKAHTAALEKYSNTKTETFFGLSSIIIQLEAKIGKGWKAVCRMEIPMSGEGRRSTFDDANTFFACDKSLI